MLRTLLALGSDISIIISLSLIRVSGFGTLFVLRGGLVVTLETGEAERVDDMEYRVTVAVVLESWLSWRLCRVRDPAVEGRDAIVAGFSH